MRSDRDIPKWPIRILRWFCKPYHLEIIEGDLLELYFRQATTNRRKAGIGLMWNIFRFFRLRFIKNIEDLRPKSSFGMYRNYLKVAIRSIKKHQSYSILNILGLAVGIAACLLIVLHVRYQFTYDRHIPDAHRIYRMVNEYDVDVSKFGRYTPALLVSQMREDFPEVETGARLFGLFDYTIRIDDQYITQDGVMSADSTFFELFPADFIAGEARTALNRPNTIVLTESLARKFFPNQNPLGKRISGSEDDYEVTAVVADPPDNTTLPYKMITSLPHEGWATNGSWTGNNFYSYVKLKNGVDMYGLTMKMRDFVRKYVSPQLLQFLAEYDSWEAFLEDGNHKSFGFKPLTDIHLHHATLSLGQGGNHTNVIVFSIIAIFILLVACINYVNMSTARSAVRAKEVGMRKVMGSQRTHIIQQFLAESVLVTLLSVLLGLVITILALPYFNYLTGMSYDVSFFMKWETLVWVMGILLIVGLLAGSYPAFFLSSFKPIHALRGESAKGGSSRLRSVLVIFQFAISVFLITGTLIVFLQVRHMSLRKLGINVEQSFVIRDAARLENEYRVFRNTLLNNTMIRNVGLMSTFPSGGIPDWSYNTVGENPVTLNPDHFFTDEHAMQSLGIELKDGEYFTGKATDSVHILVNETFARMAGWDQSIGQLVDRGRSTKYRVIGVVEDFVSRSGKARIRPQLFRYSGEIHNGDWGSGYIHVNISGDYQSALQWIESQWDEFLPGYPFNGFFLDDSFDRLYDQERKFGQLFTTFSALAIVIASIGLFALAAFTLEKRTKEIAIRKVLGATVGKVMVLIVRDFVLLIIIGSLIASPIVYYLGNDWLNDFHYRVQIMPFTFVVPILAVIVISLLTIGYKSYVAATDNPANALKQE